MEQQPQRRQENKWSKSGTIGNSGLEVAPLALGGNVFGWTADEKTSFAILDAFVDAGGKMIDTADVYSAWVPGHQGGESETVIGRWLKRDPAKRDKVVIATKVGFIGAGLRRTPIAPGLRSIAAAARDRDASTFITSTRTIREVPLADSLGAIDALAKAGKIRAIGLSQYHRRAAGRGDGHGARANGLLSPCACRPGTIIVERAKLEGPLRDTALAHGLGIFPFYGLANGFLTGKYRSKDDLDKSPRGERNVDYLEGKGMRVLAALDEIAAETGAPLGDGRAGLDQWPSPASPRRSPARPASSS